MSNLSAKNTTTNNNNNNNNNNHPVQATCHCNRITISLPEAPDEIVECGCSLCTRLGASWAFYARERVTVTATSARLLPPSSSSTPTSSSSYITRGIVTAVDEALESYVRGGADLDLSQQQQQQQQQHQDQNQNQNREPGGGRGHGHVTFLRCAHCGVVTHLWGLERRKKIGGGDDDDDDDDGTGLACPIVGVNCRLLAESDVSKAKRRTMRGPGLGCETGGAVDKTRVGPK
ncbi:hypothetical protein F5Y17DRAFT_150820 [Xylariaceae sp. FL0594]|nr:hypothetical protein F5Y17DRAFT_150820 [Xylariaceae sp. FL0594]